MASPNQEIQKLLEQDITLLHKHYYPKGWGGLDPADFQDAFIRLGLDFLHPGILHFLIDGQLGFNLTANRWVRRFLGISPHPESKATALAIRGYCKAKSASIFDDCLDYINSLADYLWDLRTGRTKHASWGASYSWMTGAGKVFPANGEALLNTAISGLAYLRAYDITKNETYLNHAVSAARYVIKENGHGSHEDGSICFYYTPLVKMQITNANAIAAQFLYALSKLPLGSQFQSFAERAFLFITNVQNEDGSWYYYPLRNSSDNVIDNYHTGFVLEAMIDALSLGYSDLLQSIKSGLEFYSKMFYPNGRPRFSIKKDYPIQIHDIAQGILVFSLAEEVLGGYRDIALSIWKFGRKEMRKENGTYKSRIWRYTENPMNYPRRADAWMFLALLQLHSIL